MKLLSLYFFVAVALGGCCVKDMDIKPTASVTGGTITVDGDIHFDFGCCLSKDEQAIALRIKNAIADDLNLVRQGKMPVADYNAEVAAAKAALNDVVNNCAQKAGIRTMVAQSAWAHARATADKLEKHEIHAKKQKSSSTH